MKERPEIPGTGIECPLITEELIHRFIQYGVDTHWGKKNTTSGKEDIRLASTSFSMNICWEKNK